MLSVKSIIMLVITNKVCVIDIINDAITMIVRSDSVVHCVISI